ncbi:MAG: SDR family oxidoreductase [Candidatus Hydrogenedentes bacterium]|nr:SDR family oxidoreductase [Candidatus Hydrogenedentota bacterium]
MSQRSVLITGATGIMGGWVLGEALRLGYAPIALMRDADLGRARERLSSVLRLVGCDRFLDDVRIVQGDTQALNLGLGGRRGRELKASLEAMVHCAACTSFDPRLDKELWETNVGGVKNVIEFLSGTDVPLYHVSTAYVAGDRTGCAYETETDCGQQFNNTYERTKHESELLVREAIAQGRIQAAIFRPAIIVGATEEGRISQFLNFYSFLRLVDVISAHPSAEWRRIRILASPDATKNLVPVDWTAQALWAIAENEGPSGQTYHLTSPNPSVLQDVVEWANAWLEPCRVRVELVEQYEERASALERLINASLRYYRPYTRGETLFDRTNTDRALGDSFSFPSMDHAHLDRMLQFARQQSWQGIFGCRPDGEESSYADRITRFFPRLPEASAVQGRSASARSEDRLVAVK